MPLQDEIESFPISVFAEETRKDGYEGGKSPSSSSPEPEEILLEASELNESHLTSVSSQKKRFSALASETEEIPLAKLVLSAEGCRLFDELWEEGLKTEKEFGSGKLSLRVDVNQRYADALPQWKDVASLLEVDSLRTQWIQACVRPNEGLTRAVMEIYMRDGGTLGEVLKALLDLGMVQILEKLEPLVRAFVEERKKNEDKPAVNNDQKVDPRFFSILSTLASVLGGDDPCMALQKFANGLKATPGVTGAPQSNDLIVHNVAVEVGNKSCPSYNSKLHLKDEKLKMGWELKKNVDKNLAEKETCRIMLLFADDGVEYSQEVYDLVQGMEFEGVTAEVFRLNESSLWYELLTHPEACCMKWANEADYVMPILTPNLLKEFHAAEAASNQELLPTSPIINRYMYTLLRARFVDNGCKNTVVRPVIPAGMAGQVGGCAAVKRDPLLRLVWVPLKGERVGARVRGMLGECGKQRRAMEEQ